MGTHQVKDTRLHDLIKGKFPIAEKQRQIMQLLADKMCDPNGRIAEGVTPLHLAVKVNNYSCMYVMCGTLDYMVTNGFTRRVGTYTVPRH